MALENNFFVKNINLAYCKPYLHHNGFIYCVYYRSNSNVVRNIPAKVVKIDTNYNLIWARQIDNLHFINQIIPGTTGNLIIYGGRYPVDTDTPNAVALKMTDAGNIRWSKEYNVETDRYAHYNIDRIMIQGISANRYVFIARESVAIIDDNGNMVRCANLDYTQSNNFTVFSGLSVYNDRIFLTGTGRFTNMPFAITELNTNLQIVNRDRFRNLSPIQTGGGVGTYHTYVQGNALYVSYSPSGNRLVASLNLTNNLSPQRAIIIDGIGANSSEQSNKLAFTNANFYFNHKEFGSSTTNYYKFDFNLNCLWSKRNSIAINAQQFQVFNDFIYLQESNRNIIKTDTELESNDCVASFTQVANPVINQITLEKQPIDDVQSTLVQVSAVNLGLVATVYTPNITLLCPTFDIDQSTITANPAAIPANGSSTSIITVQLKDANGNNITSGGETVVIVTSDGTITTTTDNGDGTYTANLSSNTVGTATLSFTVNGQNAPATTSVNFTSQNQPCEAHIAFVVDESGSIDSTEAQQIRNGLQNFVDAQLGSPFYISLIGMSVGDTGTRNDHILHQQVTQANKSTFDSWVTGFRNRGISPAADYWVSGLEVVQGLTDVPDIVVIITDGLQINTPQTLVDQIFSINNKSHIFVYGIAQGFYNSGQTGQFVDLVPSLTHYLGRTPIVSTTNSDLLITDYADIQDFSDLSLALTDLSQTLITSEVGCGNIEIIQNNTITATLQTATTVVNMSVGNIRVRNDKSTAHTIAANTQIATVNGIVYTTTLQVVVPANGGEINVPLQINGTPISEGTFSQEISIPGVLNPQQFAVSHIVQGGEIVITEFSSIQSPNFYLQAAGSTGNDGSAQGIHTRWVFSGALGEKHLPKGNYASNTNNFNKADDFVRVYRAPYRKVAKIIDFAQAPNIVDDANGVWIYRIERKDFHVYFRNQTQYTQVRAVINPATNALGFMQNYGSELIEVESKRNLFFAVEATVSAFASNSSLQTETLSVSTNTLIALKKATNRKTYQGIALQNIRLLSENGRSFRFIGTNTYVTKLSIELYGDFIEETNENQLWTPMGSYALTLEDSVALQQLEPSAGLVNGNWPRFNDDATVNIANYVNKWNVVEADIYDRYLKDVVEKYISLSNDINNPKAVEEIPVDENIVVEGEDDVMEISNLDMLNIASYDYHMARMLGLGFLDTASQVQQGEFVYLAEYVTFGDLEDGQGAREVQHLSMSLPTATSDERLPLPVSLNQVIPGAYFGTETSEPSSITDDDGYTHDGRKRFVTLYAAEIPEDAFNPTFYTESTQFEAKEYTIPIYAGLEYRKQRQGQPDPGVWEKPEISHDKRYLHIDTTVSNASERYEAFPITLPEVGQPIFVHKQIISGTHYYGSYGINWFSRATSSPAEVSIVTALQPKNPLLPPSNIQPHLVQKEQPLLLTSQEEQDRYDAISGDKTLARISFDYHSYQELVDYAVPEDSAITDAELVSDTTSVFDDNDEIFAENIDIFFRNEMPNNISGQVISVVDDPTNNLVSIVTVDEYYLSSVDQTLTPSIPNGLESNYEGGVFIIGEQQHIIHEVTQTGGFPQFKVYKKEISDALVDDIPTPDADELQAIEITNDGIFMAIENMQTPSSWGTPNPQPLHVKADTFNQIHREVVMVEGDAGELERHLEKTRGIWSDAASNHTTITKVDEVIDLDAGGNPIMGHKGMYNITFHGIVLDQHVQYSDNSDSVEWYRGIVRVRTVGNPSGKRKVLKVAKILNIKNVGDTTESDVQVLAFDPLFSTAAGYDPIQIGTNVSVNFYPGYKVYLYENQLYGLTETNLLPGDDEEVRNSIVGLRSHDTDNPYYSAISIPKIMFAQKIIEAQQPEQPDGAKYATRPDFFGRSTYTITTEYKHKPHGVLFYRANDEAILNALYEKETILDIRAQLKALGGNNELYFNKRWENLLDFEKLALEGDFRVYPPVGVSSDNYKFPNPDKVALFEWANDIIARINSNTAFPPPSPVTPFVADPDAANTDVGNIAVGDPRLLGFVKGVIFNAFVPLTEVPVVYAYINGPDYTPVNEKQVLRDSNGSILSPSDPAFRMAPMMKFTSTSPHITQFTDFNLDGTSNNIYYYAARELSSQMKLGEFSRALGPIKLVTSNAPEAPEVKRIMPVLENVVSGTPPRIQLEINSYPEIQDIKKVNIYRAFNKLDAQSIRTMTFVDSVDVDAAGLAGNELWTVYDDFTDLDEVPYGDGLFYRLTVSREIKYVEADYNNGTPEPPEVTDYAPSQASKIVASMMVEVSNPPAPTIQYIAEPIAANGDINQIALQWEKTCYKGTYLVYKMNAQGNWVKIHELTTNAQEIFVLLADTSLQDHSLATQDADGNPIYHHFKVVAQNTSGMQSINENILTIPNTDSWIDIGGIGDMIIGTTFTIR